MRPAAMIAPLSVAASGDGPEDGQAMVGGREGSGARSPRRRLLRWGACVLALLLPLSAMAQGSPTELRRELDAIYQKLLTDPSDRALNRRMIEIAKALKDYDAAIGAVERLIFYEPNNPALQLEAAQLYLEIDSKAAARGYLNDALAMPQTKGEIRAEVERLIAKIDVEERPSVWDAIVQTGLRYQSNANVGPSFLGPEEPFFFDGPIPDWNAFALGTLGLNAPVGKHLALEASLSGYYADQFKVNRLDLGFLELQGGPRLIFGEGGFSLKPYGIVQGILLGGDPYQRAFGGGVTSRINLFPGWYLEPQFEYKNRLYYNSEDYPKAIEQNGDLYLYAANLNGRIADNVDWTSRFAYSENYADKDYFGYRQYLASVGFDVDFELFGVENWSFGPFASVVFTDFSGIDPIEELKQSGIIRKDFQWNVGVNLDIPLSSKMSVAAQVQYTKNESNLDRFTYDNLQVLFGPQGRF
jgi:hypothetical protein